MNQAQPSIAGIARQLWGGAVRLASLELASARIELAAKVKGIAVAAVLLAFALIAVVFGAFALTQCAIFALALVVQPWIAALIVAAAWVLLAAIGAAVAGLLLRRALPPIPTKTLQSVKEDVQWAKSRASSAKI